MERLYIDCREFPSDSGCTVAICADTTDELVDAAVQHAIAVHSATDTPEFRVEIRSCIHIGTPPMKAA